MRRTVSTATALLLLAGATAAHASTATTVGSQKLFARQTGCGATQEAGRLETRTGVDTADGCGTIGGIPLGELLGGTPETYTTLETYKPVVLAAGKVTGQVAADSWTGFVGGVGTVSIEVAVSGLDAEGETVDVGSTTVTRPASPTTPTVRIPFEIPVPAGAAGTSVSTWSLTLTVRGQNVNANAQALSGDVFMTLPVLK